MLKRPGARFSILDHLHYFFPDAFNITSVTYSMNIFVNSNELTLHFPSAEGLAFVRVSLNRLDDRSLVDLRAGLSIFSEIQ
jgi:hypothetical protein